MSTTKTKPGPKTGAQILEDLPPVKAIRNEVKKCKRFWNSCLKPSPKEYRKLVIACAIGVVASGSLGYAVKAVCYPVFRALAMAARK